MVATGGMPMVKSAYSSGKPSFGVGAGNVQVILDRFIDFDVAAEKVITGRSFDTVSYTHLSHFLPFKFSPVTDSKRLLFTAIFLYSKYYN